MAKHVGSWSGGELQVLQSPTAVTSVFGCITWRCFAGLSNGDGPASESDIFRKACAQLVKYMNSGNRLLHKNFMKQDVVQRFLRLLSSLQGNLSHKFTCGKGGLCSFKLFLCIS